MSFQKLLVSLVLTTLFATTAHAIPWKGVFVAGDNSIDNFDNGRIALTELFSERGDLSTAQVSSSDKFISKRVLRADAGGIFSAFENMSVQPGEGCFVHMTSHGTKGHGFYLALEGILTPDTLADLVDASCGDVPTVIMVSACYSGQFITEKLAGPNRIILTAARADRPSFGCSTDTEFTYWDGCILSETPHSETWADLYENVNACITEKESLIGVAPSEPQAFFGENTFDWVLFH